MASLGRVHKLELKNVKNIAIVYRRNTNTAVNLAKDLTKWLKQKSITAWTAPEQNLIPGTKTIKTSKQWGQIGLVIVIGGDGTYLRAVRLLEGRHIPILGVNAGSLGFLTGTRISDLYTTVEKVFQNKMEVRLRSMISYAVHRKGKKLKSGLSLNDLVVERGSTSQLIDVEVYSDKYLVSEIKADGVILASPTGSTAYNLAAGGPILHPQVNAFVITPVAPHSLTSRPFIFPDDRPIVLKLQTKSKNSTLVSDGQQIVDLLPGDEVIITRAAEDHFMVREPNHNHFHLLREKFKFGDRN